MLAGALVAWPAAAAGSFIFVRVGVVAKGAEDSALHGDRGARVERRLRRRLRRRGCRVPEVAMTGEPCNGASVHAAHDVVELVVRGRGGRMEHSVGIGVPREDAVEHHHVEVDVEVDRGSEALNEG